ncbi:hypothetical protein [Chitinophaga vietnamensis]|uniref:hypothetical protein n=1 Tax=Chitinophaga vietnamensis TaxID=2593957 RepID=UPI001178B386|nr:hypothetical protein [Chitinophaga vietnamensis]
MSFTSIPIVATAIAIVISWALFAILCSLIQEGIAQIKAERGRFMKHYLLQQLQDFPNGVNWASLLYLHGSVDLLSRAHNKPTSEITPRLFAETLIDVVGKSQIVQKDSNLVSQFVGYQHPTLASFKSATMLLNPSDVVTLFRQALNSAELSAVPRRGEPLNETLIYSNLVANLESWYADFTGRLNIWYKKKTRYWLFFIGIITGTLLNVDTVQLFTYYLHEPAARQVMISYYEKDSSTLTAYAQRLDTAGLSRNVDSVRNDIKNYTHNMQQLITEATLPVGWEYNIFHQARFVKPGTRTSFYSWKIIGLLLTGFAASLGAPFWFDLLRRAYSKKV